MCIKHYKGTGRPDMNNTWIPVLAKLQICQTAEDLSASSPSWLFPGSAWPEPQNKRLRLKNMKNHTGGEHPDVWWQKE